VVPRYGGPIIYAFPNGMTLKCSQYNNSYKGLVYNVFELGGIRDTYFHKLYMVNELLLHSSALNPPNHAP
jgi:hypothetical protein